MSFRLVDANWARELSSALQTDSESLHIICPFIKRTVAERLLKHGKPRPLRVLTRFNLLDAFAGVTDLSALRLLVENGAEIRGVKNLHAKVYIFGRTSVIVSSANLTEAALRTNHEFGFVAQDKALVGECRRYFDDLWAKAGANLNLSRLAKWEVKVEACLAMGGRIVTPIGLSDEGAEMGIPSAPTGTRGWAEEPGRAFVKFLGEGHNRADPTMVTLEEVERAGCHWACAWPKGKRPRQVADGDVLFLGRLVEHPNDILIFGRAIGLRHRGEKDDATPAEIAVRPWKARWPHYVRVHHPEFVAGSISNGVSLGDLMNELAKDSFVSTQRNAAAGVGNANPRLAFRQQPAVELSAQGRRWLGERLERSFQLYGRLPAASLEGID